MCYSMFANDLWASYNASHCMSLCQIEFVITKIQNTELSGI